MENEALQLKIYTVLKLSKLMYRNEMRQRFEIWAMKQATKHKALLEDITRSDKIWKWYIQQYNQVEKRFYRENKIFVDESFSPNHLYEIFALMAHEIEDHYPITLIQNLKHGQTAIN